jgi:hypothetical protein
LHHRCSHDIKCLCFFIIGAHKNNLTPLEDINMKKIFALLALALMIVGLSGCMDDPDGSKQKVSSSISL